MADIRKILAWFFAYLVASFFSFVVAFFGLDFFLPNDDVSERASAPYEQQLYLLLVDRGYWLTGNSLSSEFRKGMTRQGRDRFSALLNDIRFKRDCLGGKDKKDGKEMECTVNGELIYFTKYDG